MKFKVGDIVGENEFLTEPKYILSVAKDTYSFLYLIDNQYGKYPTYTLSNWFDATQQLITSIFREKE